MPKFNVALDLQKNELRNARVQNLAAAPSSPVVGQIYFDTAIGQLFFWDGTQWTGTNQSAGGGAGGSLTGSYPNPTIASGAIVDAMISASAAIALSKLAVDPLARANHTGSQLAATISNFDTQVRTSTLNQMAPPTAFLPMNTQRITGLADPTNPQDAATKAYVDATAQGLDLKASVRAATTANITLSGLQTLDNVALAAGNRVLVKDQTTQSANGIYVAASGAWTRAVDADGSGEITAGMFTFVEEGVTQGNTGWLVITNNPITVGTTALAFTQFSAAGTYLGGAGLVKTGTTFDVVGTANRITANADSIDIASTYVGQTSLTTLGTIATGTWQGTPVGIAYGGTGATTAAAARTALGAPSKVSAALAGGGTSEVVTHNLNTRDVQVVVYTVAAPYEDIYFDIERTDLNTVTIRSATTIPASTYRAVIVG